MMNIIVVILEVVAVIGFFSISNKLLDLLFNQTSKIKWLQIDREKIDSNRQLVRRFVGIICLVIGGLVIVKNGILIYQGQNVWQYQVGIIRRIPGKFWLELVAAIFKTVSLVLMVNYGLKYLRQLLDFLCVRAEEYEQITINNHSIRAFFLFLKRTLTSSLWLLVGILCAQFLFLPAIVAKYLLIALRIYIIATLSFLIGKALSAIVDTLDGLVSKYPTSDSWLRIYERLRNLIPLFKKCLTYTLYVGAAILIIRQIDFIAWIANYGSIILQLIGIIFTCAVLGEITQFFVEELMLRTSELSSLQKQRRLTIIPLIESFLKYLIYFGGGTAVLYVIGVNPTPILAGAGIVGLAVGFGAQNLINDIVCGFFILFENYYLVGDYIEVEVASGIVEAIDLRTTRIRHSDGQLYIVRNGSIKDIVNYSKQYLYAVVVVRVGYSSDLNHVYNVLEKVGRDLQNNFADVIEATEVQGIDKFGESDLSIRTVTKVKPGTKARVERTLRKMIKEAFDRENIEIPFPHRVLVIKNESNNNFNYQESDRHLNIDDEVSKFID